MADKRWGHGSFRFADGETYEGGFKAGLPDGEGSYRFPDGRVCTGEFRAGAGVLWSDDKQRAWKLNNGKAQGEVSLDEAKEFAARVQALARR